MEVGEAEKVSLTPDAAVIVEDVVQFGEDQDDDDEARARSRARGDQRAVVVGAVIVEASPPAAAVFVIQSIWIEMSGPGREHDDGRHRVGRTPSASVMVPPLMEPGATVPTAASTVSPGTLTRQAFTVIAIEGADRGRCR